MDSSVDIEQESWKAGTMKTIMDLPENLIQEMKFRAVPEGKKIRDLGKEVLRRGLAAQFTPVGRGSRHGVKLPIIPCPTGKKLFGFTGNRLQELTAEGERTDQTP